MVSFSDKWNALKNNEKLSQAFMGKVKPEAPLKNRLDTAQKKLQLQITRLGEIDTKLKSKHDVIFSKIVDAKKSNNETYAKVYANELAEVRKMNKMVTQSKLALEQIALRLNTVSELGDVVVTLTPAMGVIKNIQSGVMNILPEAEHEISEINGLLSGILVDAGQMGGHNINFENSSAESRQIMDEASAIAEEKMKEQFPDLPSAADSLLPPKNKIEGLFE